MPHPSTIQKWYISVDGAPGFTNECLKAVELKVNEIKGKNKKLIYGLVLDEMSIREDIYFNGTRLQGYINFGQRSNTSDTYG